MPMEIDAFIPVQNMTLFLCRRAHEEASENPLTE